MYTNAKIRMYVAVIYLFKVNKENSRTRYVIGSKLTTTKKNNLKTIKMT